LLLVDEGYLAPQSTSHYCRAMTHSKKEIAERNAKIRAEKLRENLARRKHQSRQRLAEPHSELPSETSEPDETTDKNSLG
jgi:hypothetical protein